MQKGCGRRRTLKVFLKEMYSVSLCSCAGPQDGRCSAPAPWQVGKTPLQVRVQCKILMQSTKCWLVTAVLSVCQGNRHTQQSSTITWAEIKSRNDFLRTFLALAGRRNDFYFSTVYNVQSQMLG